MINLYIDFDGVIKDTIRVSYKMMADLGIDLKNKAQVISFYQQIDWNELLASSEELNNAFSYIDKISSEGIYRPAILTTVNSLEEMIAKTNYIRSKNSDISIICVPCGVEKCQMVPAKNSILVDDFSGNLESWQRAGGIGVKFGEDSNYFSINSLKSFVDDSMRRNLSLV